jgi:hypothetical protein
MSNIRTAATVKVHWEDGGLDEFNFSDLAGAIAFHQRQASRPRVIKSELIDADLQRGHDRKN